MKHALKTYFLTLGLALALFFSFATNTYAEVIDVQFQTSPLFGDTNLLPGDSITKTFSVINTSGETQILRMATVGETSGGLEEALVLILADSVITHYTGTLEHLYNEDYVALGTITDGDTKTYTATVDFPIEAGNAYKGKSTGFDLCVGFAGENPNCVTSLNPERRVTFTGEAIPDSLFASERTVLERDRALLSERGAGSSGEGGAVRDAVGNGSEDASSGIETKSFGPTVFSLPSTSEEVLRYAFFFMLILLVVTLVRKRARS